MNHKSAMRNKVLLLAFLGMVCYSIDAQSKSVNVQSPDGKLKVVVDIKEKMYYSVISQSDTILKDCTLSMTLSDDVLGLNPRIRSIKRSRIDKESIRPIPLKNAVIRNHCNTLCLNMSGNYSVEFRAYNEGIAYRFITDKKHEIEVLGEDFTVQFPSNYLAHISRTSGFKTSYENPYSHVNTVDYKPLDEMSYFPVLLESPQGYNILISEADLDDYPCMFVKGTGDNGLTAVFPKCPIEFGEDGDRSVKILKEADYIAKTEGKRTFPWRFFVISSDDKEILSNEMVYNLSSPCELEDCSWIKPGQVSWEWWNGAAPYGPDVNFVSGFNMDTYKYFIDFAAKYKIPYILMDEGWALSTRDPYTPNPEVNVHEIIRYGKEKGVGVMLWLTWLTVENHFDVFKTFADWGVAGIKIDFMDRSDQWMVNYYERVAKEAAKHHLLIDFHGSFKPAGLEHRYPNILSYEGVRGMEQMGGCYPDNSLYLPFIRNAVGSMDYTPGAMINMQPEVYRSERPNSASIGTRAYQLALYIVFESGLQMLADNPTLYYRNPDCTNFITNVPVTWDETKVLDAKIGEYVVLARRKGKKWFVGAICNGKEKVRKFSLSFDFLDRNRTYQLVSFEDGINADRQAMDYRREERKIDSSDKLDIKLVRNGGWVAVIE